MQLFTELEADQCYQVSLCGLSRDELIHLGMLARVLDDEEHKHRFAIWFLSTLKLEIDRLDGNDTIEPGVHSVPIRQCSTKELFAISVRLHLWRQITSLSEAERQFLGDLHWLVIANAHVRLDRPQELDRYLSISDLAFMLDATLSQVQSLVRRGVLPKPKRLSTKHHVWNRQEVIQAVNAL